MKESSQEHERNEKVVDQFIDDLIADRAPEVYRSGPVDRETERILETVRILRRHGKSGRQREQINAHRWLKGIATLAAAVLILVLGSIISNLPWIEYALPGGKSGHKAGNTVEAAVRAYEELQSYSGVFEIRSEQNGEPQFLETVTICYQKPNRYAAVHRFDGNEQLYTSNGEKVVAQETPGVLTVDNLFPEKYLWRYHIGTVVRELAVAEKVETTQDERLFGREAELLTYRYPGSEEGEFCEVWIDRATFLPLRKVLHYPGGNTLIVEFKELSINPPLGPALFEVPQGQEGAALNRLGRLEQVTAAWPGVETILPSIDEEMKLWKTGLLDGNRFEYVLRFRGKKEGDFLDIYYSSKPATFCFLRKSMVGLLGEGVVELNPAAWNALENYSGPSRTAWWVTGGHEVYMVSSRSTVFLQSLMEMLAGEKMKQKSVQEMIGLGYEPAAEKEGH